jgi:hypothetical protein
MAGDSVLKTADAAQQPRVEFTTALDHLKQSLGHYAPELKDVNIRVMYEYAAGRLLRDSVPCPQRIVQDLRNYLADQRTWWEGWRNENVDESGSRER